MDIPASPSREKNPLVTVEDLQRAYVAIIKMGYDDSMERNLDARPKKSGRAIAEELLFDGSWTRAQQMAFKAAYLAGFELGKRVRRRSSKKSVAAQGE